MSTFQSFCKNIHKTKAGYVPDLLDLVAQGFGDLCMAAFIADNVSLQSAEKYTEGSEVYKNDIYSIFESNCQDAIDAYNQTIDGEREKAKNLELIDDHVFISMIDPDYKFRHFNQDMFDAGHKPSDFC
jgi:hypothetical protein